MSYKLVGTSASRAFRALWMLEELGLTYDHIAARLGSDEARQHNPSGKVPVLYDDAVPIPDSTAILHYLADKHGKFTFAAGTLDRARQDGLTFRLLDELDAVLWTAARHSFILPEVHRLPEIKSSLKWEFTRNQRRFSTELDGPFLMGAQMTVPDLILAHCLSWATNAKFPEIEPNLQRWLAAMQARPAYQQARTK